LVAQYIVEGCVAERDRPPRIPKMRKQPSPKSQAPDERLLPAMRAEPANDLPDVLGLLAGFLIGMIEDLSSMLTLFNTPAVSCRLL
jgi:hypothetical protein